MARREFFILFFFEYKFKFAICVQFLCVDFVGVGTGLETV